MLTLTLITPQVFLKRLIDDLTPERRSARAATPLAELKATETRLRATATAALYRHASTHFSWGFGESAAVMGLCKGAGRFITDLMGTAIPGARKLNGIRGKCNRWVKEWVQQFQCRTKTMVTLVFDNIGVYHAGTSLASGEALHKCVVTNAGVVHTSGTDMENLQRKTSLSPAYWTKTWSSIPEDFFSTKIDARAGEDMSEKKLLDEERDEFILDAFKGLGAARDHDGKWSDEIVRWVCRREPTCFCQRPMLLLN